MYPETDVPPIRVTKEHWASILAILPAKPEERVSLLVKDHGVSADVAMQLVRDGSDADFTAWTGEGIDAALAARILLQLLPQVQRPEAVRAHVPAVAAALEAGRFAKEAIPAILEALDRDPALGVDGAIQAAGAGAVAEDEVERVVQRVVDERIDFVRQRGLAAVGPLMGPVMAQLRGKADGALISAKLKQAVEAAQQ